MRRPSGKGTLTVGRRSDRLAGRASAGLGLLEVLCALAVLGLLASALELQYGCLRLLSRTASSFEAAIEAEAASRFKESDCHEFRIGDTRAALLCCRAQGIERFALVRNVPES